MLENLSRLLEAGSLSKDCDKLISSVNLAQRNTHACMHAYVKHWLTTGVSYSPQARPIGLGATAA